MAKISPEVRELLDIESGAATVKPFKEFAAKWQRDKPSTPISQPELKALAEKFGTSVSNQPLNIRRMTERLRRLGLKIEPNKAKRNKARRALGPEIRKSKRQRK